MEILQLFNKLGLNCARLRTALVKIRFPIRFASLTKIYYFAGFKKDSTFFWYRVMYPSKLDFTFCSIASFSINSILFKNCFISTDVD